MTIEVREEGLYEAAGERLIPYADIQSVKIGSFTPLVGEPDPELDASTSRPRRNTSSSPPAATRANCTGS